MKNLYLNRKKIFTSIIVIAILIIFYTLFGFFGTPWILKSIVPNLLADKNVTLIIKDAKFNPYKFELNATNISLKSYTDIFMVSQLDFKFSPIKLLNGDLDINLIRLKEPFINIQKESNYSFNFDSLISKNESSDNNKSSNNRFLNVILDKVDIINGDLRYADNSLKRPFEINIKDISYQILDINLDKYSVGKHSLDGNSTIFDRLDWHGGVSLNPLKIYGDVKFSGFDLGKIAPSYINNSELNVTDGKLDANLSYNITIDSGGIYVDLNNSKITAHNFDFRNKNTVLNFNRFDINDLKIALLIDENSTLNSNGNIKSINLTSLHQNGVLKLDFDKILLNDISYSFANDFTLKILDINVSKFDVNAGGFNGGIDRAGLKNIDFNANENFNQMKLKFPKLAFGGIEFKGFGFVFANENLSFNDFNASLNLDKNDTKIMAILNKVESGKIDLNSNKKSFVKSNGIKAEMINFDGNNLGLNSIFVDKTNFLSANKEFVGFEGVYVGGLNFNNTKTILQINDIKVNSLYYDDWLDLKGSRAIGNLDFLKQQDQNKKDIKKTKNGENKFLLNIDKIDFVNTKANITQDFLNSPLKHEISLKKARVEKFSSDFTRPFLLNLEAKTGESLGVEADGEIKLEPLNVKLKTKSKIDDLSKLNKILSIFLNAKFSSGKILMKSDINLNKSLEINSDFNLRNFRLNDTNGKKIATLEQLKIKNLALNDNRLKIQDLAINSPFLATHIDKDKRLNWAYLIKNSNQNDANLNKKNDSQVNKSDFKIALENVSLNKVDIDFSDDSLVLPFLFKIKNLNIKVDKIQNNAISNINASGTVGSGGSANIFMQIDALNPKKMSDISLKFKDIELNEVTPYSATFVGRKIDSGFLDLSLWYLIKDGKLDGKNNVVIHKIKLGESVKSDSAVSLPLQLAISILQDSNNVIDLNLPISGNLDSPEFSYSGIVWQAIKQLFSDIVTSPFRLIGKLLGVSNADELSSIDFTAANSEILDSQIQKIEQLKKIADDKKDVIFVIIPGYDEVVDKFALQKKLLLREVLATVKSSGKSEFEVINAMAINQLKNPPANPYDDLARLRKILPQDLEQLAKDRSNNLYEALIKAGVNKDQLKVSDKIQKIKAKMELYIGLGIAIEVKK